MQLLALKKRHTHAVTTLQTWHATRIQNYSTSLLELTLEHEKSVDGRGERTVFPPRNGTIFHVPNRGGGHGETKMMEESEKRSYETKLAILKAASHLCERREFSRVSVAAIAKEARIGRSSFYYHFSDRNAMVSWLSDEGFRRGIGQIGRTMGWYEGHLKTTNMLIDYHPLITGAAKANGYSSADASYLRYRQKNLLETLGMRHVEITPRLRFQVMGTAYLEQRMTSGYL